MKVTSFPVLFTRCLFKSIQLFIYILLLTSFSIIILFDLSTKDQIVYVFSGQKVSKNPPTPQKINEANTPLNSLCCSPRLCGRTPTADVLKGHE